MYKLLIVEDDYSISEKIKNKLQQWDYKVVVAQEFRTIDQLFIQEMPDLVMLDINLPYFDGFHWCKHLRKLSKVPILMVSARDSSMDQIMAMDLGADDYIVKPFAMDIFIAKIKALLRRNYAYQDASLNILVFKDLKLKISQSQLLVADQSIALTKNELIILEQLFSSPQKIHKRDELMQQLWESEAFVDDNTLSVNINRLRKKLKRFEITDLILTKKGMGYYLNDNY
jgi:OmpR family two-component system bacitracin resistance response regulator BceR